MPARTNDFQELVATIQRTTAPAGAKVTASAMVGVDGLDTPREVDILVEGKFGSTTVKVAYEAKDEKRPFDLTDFDSLTAKYRGECRVLVDRLVIVTRRGFTAGVREKAKKLDVELLTLDEAKQKDWSSEFWATVHFTFTPHICSVAFLPPIPKPTQEIAANARVLCSCCKRDFGTPMQLANRLMFQQFFPRNPEWVRKLNEQVNKSPDGQAYLTAKRAVKDRLLRFDGKEYNITNMAIVIHSVSAIAKLNCRKYELTSVAGQRQAFRRMDAIVGGRQIDLLFPEDPNVGRMALTLSSPRLNKEPRPRQNAKNRQSKKPTKGAGRKKR